jgi:hypothetical protein
MMFLKTARVATTVGEHWPEPVRRLRRQIAVIATASTALLWVHNLSEHYRGALCGPSPPPPTPV